LNLAFEKGSDTKSKLVSCLGLEKLKENEYGFFWGNDENIIKLFVVGVT
jgi:hypothetical protein